ncbi:hypothetical protein NG727_28080, partial [Klebsiella pneumoniae]|nr:hypothetical protein [Klebsiella pneumoniae]MDQ6364846.1 hypothetical protein [Klebsiella pneumoniae]
MHKRLVVNIFSSLLLGAALISAPVYAAEKTVVNISKVDGMPWFNRMGEGVVGNDSNLLIVFYVQIVPDDFVMQLHR